MTPRRSPRGLVLAAALATAAAAAAQDAAPRAVREKRAQAEVATIAGPLRVCRIDFEDGGHTNQVSLAAKPLFEEPEDESVSISASHPEKGPARVVLLQLNTGGSGCPSFYAVVEIKDDGRTLRSKRFGNCSPLARSSYAAGVLRIDIPRIGGAAPQSWRYRSGKLSKAVRPRR